MGDNAWIEKHDAARQLFCGLGKIPKNNGKDSAEMLPSVEIFL